MRRTVKRAARFLSERGVHAASTSKMEAGWMFYTPRKYGH
jgi:hypothetical protein